jgi:hypothetical protein
MTASRRLPEARAIAGRSLQGLRFASTIQARYGDLYYKSCRYLYLNGVRDINTGSETPSREGAEATTCALLANSG